MKSVQEFPSPHPKKAAAPRAAKQPPALWCTVYALLACLFFAGCDSMQEPDRGAHQSLVEIGERSLEQAERLENGGRRAEANSQYKRALWAFTYHERLTGEEPFLLDDALDGIARTGSR